MYLKGGDSINLKFEIAANRLKVNEIAIFWLGQAGFLLKDSDDNVVVIDPYLTDCGERIRGFKRMTPKIISPNEIEADVFIATHTHFDHFDIYAIPIIASCSKTNFFGPKPCRNKFYEIGIAEERVTLLEEASEVVYKDIVIQGAYADHGEMAPDAIGVLLEIKGTRLYFTGDTAYRPEKMKQIKDFKPDIVVLSVNGEFGNLNSHEGALVARDVGAKIAIPCHFWTFIEHGGDPQRFNNEMKKWAPNCQIKYMYQGEMFKFCK